MWLLWKILYYIRQSEDAHVDSWGTQKLQMWFLWKILQSSRKSEDTHQDSSWNAKKQMRFLWKIIYVLNQKYLKNHIKAMHYRIVYLLFYTACGVNMSGCFFEKYTYFHGFRTNQSHIFVINLFFLKWGLSLWSKP